MSRAALDVRILVVVDDAEETREILRRNLTARGYGVNVAASAMEAIRMLESATVDIVITDFRMPGVDGRKLTRHVAENFRDVEVVMITGYGSIENAVSAMKAGVAEYLTKPFTDEELFAACDRALEKLSLRKLARGRGPALPHAPRGILGESRAMREVFRLIEKAARVSAPVLITGESGTGKEMVARAIHYGSSRSSAPFVPVNCGAIPEGLIESELFGYVKGAFTGAEQSRAGYFQTAEGGTLLLDEIGETSPSMQVKLLRVAQDGEIAMVGSARPLRVDVRIIATTNKDLADRYAVEYGRETPHFTEEAIAALRRYNWPGNVRELQNVVQRILLMSEGGPIEAPDLPELMRFSGLRRGGYERTLEEAEAEHIGEVMAAVQGNKSRAAEILGIDRKTLAARLKRHAGENHASGEKHPT